MPRRSGEDADDMDTSDNEGLQHNEKTDHSPDGEKIPTSLTDAAATWIERGYRVQYTDPYLMQLVRRDWPRGRSLLLLGGAALAFATGAIALTAGLRSRTWHVVSIATGPDGRILTHSVHSPKPPPTD